MLRPPDGSAVLLIATIAALGCGTSGTDETAGMTATATTTAATGSTTGSSATGTSGADASSGDGDGDTTTTGDGDAPPPYCHAACGGAGECIAAQTCSAGSCTIGCASANDCLAGDVCVDYGSGLRCANGCTAASDCVLAGGAWDEDNWSCEQGGCNYLGCTSDAECLPGQSCRPFSGVLEVLLGYNAPACVLSCTTAADCDLGAEPTTADNYECVDGGCKWIGCLNDAECPTAQTCG